MWREISEALSECRDVSMQSNWIKKTVHSLPAEPMSRKTFLAGIASEDSSAAFWVGYQVAIQKLFSPLLNEEIAAFLVNENKSSKPADWETKLNKKEQGFELQGQKDFVTAPDQIDVLLVAANIDDSIDIGGCRVCKIQKESQGVLLNDFKLPILSNLQKARSLFNKVNVLNQNILGVDGYSHYVKPFRLVEDFYVSISLLGFITRLVLKLDMNKECLSEFFEEITLVYEGMVSCEERLNEALVAQLYIPDLSLEVFIKKVGMLIVDTLSEEGVLGSYGALQQDLMILKIGQKARDIRYRRAFEGLQV